MVWLRSNNHPINPLVSQLPYSFKFKCLQP
jgi:hypothetical protein